MKHKNLVLLVPFFIASHSCDITKGKTVKSAAPMTFDQEWKDIRKATNSQSEATAITKFIDHLHDDDAYDSTGYHYGINYSYEDVRGNRRPLADLFDKKAKDSVQTIVIEVSPYIHEKILPRQTYKNWKPKDWYNLRYFVDEQAN